MRFGLASPVLAVLLLFSAASRPAQAIPLFAHRFGVSCQTCHTVVPRLNGFGERFRDAGYRWPAPVRANAAFPVAMKANLAYASAADPSGLPKAIVDEVEFLTMGSAGAHLNYRVEQYAIDGGRIGSTRDAYVAYSSDPLAAWRETRRPTIGVTVGQFTLPLPDDPETMRPTQNHYAVFDQTVGSNPFVFFDDRLGVQIGASLRDADAHLVAATNGDRMLAARVGTPELSLHGYAYRGARALGTVRDAFWRRGVAVTSVRGKARTSLLAQTGKDSSADGRGNAAFSSGGYAQEEWAFSDRLIGVVRYDSANTAGSPLRSTTFALNFRPFDRVRFSVEGVFATRPATQRTLNVAWLFAY
ncbi:MAG TPA: hypothetical protein VIG32_02200 [Candidatus Baltobacteraceae bacterium]|jgi:hypothetical protein